MSRNDYQQKRAHGREVKLMIDEASRIFKESINALYVKDSTG
jgi:hypothetical protein